METASIYIYWIIIIIAWVVFSPVVVCIIFFFTLIYAGIRETKLLTENKELAKINEKILHSLDEAENKNRELCRENKQLGLMLEERKQT